MSNFNVQQIYNVAVDLLGRPRARFIGQSLLYVGWIALILWLGSIIYGVARPFVVAVMEVTDFTISIDNIGESFVALTITTALLSIAIILGNYFIFRALRRQGAPQGVIDKVADYRSDGISILNDRPKDLHADFQRWRKRWTDWADDVGRYLGDNFTMAEQFSFTRLGIIREIPWGNTKVSPEHAHCLNMLAKQLDLLESLIQRHLDRR